MNKVHKLSCIRTVSIDAGHRLHNHEGKCRNVHGHRYRFELFITDEDPYARGVKLSIENYIEDWLMEHWDHGMLLNKEDPKAVAWAPGGMLEGDKYYLLPCNPTAENLASFVLEKANEICKKEGLHQRVFHVACWETPNCKANAEI